MNPTLRRVDNLSNCSSTATSIPNNPPVQTVGGDSKINGGFVKNYLLNPAEAVWNSLCCIDMRTRITDLVFKIMDLLNKVRDIIFSHGPLKSTQVTPQPPTNPLVSVDIDKLDAKAREIANRLNDDSDKDQTLISFPYDRLDVTLTNPYNPLPSCILTETKGNTSLSIPTGTGDTVDIELFTRPPLTEAVLTKFMSVAINGKKKMFVRATDVARFVREVETSTNKNVPKGDSNLAQFLWSIEAQITHSLRIKLKKTFSENVKHLALNHPLNHHHQQILVDAFNQLADGASTLADLRGLEGKYYSHRLSLRNLPRILQDAHVNSTDAAVIEKLSDITSQLDLQLNVQVISPEQRAALEILVLGNINRDTSLAGLRAEQFPDEQTIASYIAANLELAKDIGSKELLESTSRIASATHRAMAIVQSRDNLTDAFDQAIVRTMNHELCPHPINAALHQKLQAAFTKKLLSPQTVQETLQAIEILTEGIDDNLRYKTLPEFLSGFLDPDTIQLLHTVDQLGFELGRALNELKDRRIDTQITLRHIMLQQLKASDLSQLNSDEAIQQRIAADVEKYRPIAQTIVNMSAAGGIHIYQLLKILQTHFAHIPEAPSTAYLEMMDRYLASAKSVLPDPSLQEFSAKYPLSLKHENGVLRFDPNYPTNPDDPEFHRNLEQLKEAQVPLYESQEGSPAILASVDLFYLHLASLLETDDALAARKIDIIESSSSNGSLYSGELPREALVVYGSPHIKKQHSIGYADGYYKGNPGEKKKPYNDRVGIGKVTRGHQRIHLLAHADGSGSSKEAGVAADLFVTSGIKTMRNLFKQVTISNAREAAQVLLHALNAGSKAVFEKGMRGEAGATTAIVGAILPKSAENKAAGHIAVFVNMGDCGVLKWNPEKGVTLLGNQDQSAAFNVVNPGGQIGTRPAVLPRADGLEIFAVELAEGEGIISSSDGVLDNLFPHCFFQTPMEAYHWLTDEEKAGLSGKEIPENWNRYEGWFEATEQLSVLNVACFNKKASEILQAKNCRLPEEATRTLLEFANERAKQKAGDLMLADENSQPKYDRTHFGNHRLGLTVDKDGLVLKQDHYSIAVIKP